MLLALPHGVAADLDKVVVGDEWDEEVGVDRGFREGEERVRKVRPRSRPAGHNVSLAIQQARANETYQAVKPFRSRTSGCSQMSSVRSCSIEMKLRSELRLAGTSTGRDWARRRAVELGGQSESHGVKPVGSESSKDDGMLRTVSA